jgi:hypothetical protein
MVGGDAVLGKPVAPTSLWLQAGHRTEQPGGNRLSDVVRLGWSGARTRFGRIPIHGHVDWGWTRTTAIKKLLPQRALGCFPRRNTPGKCPDKAIYSHAYPAGHIVGLLDEILSRICLAYLLVNVGYSNRFSMWDNCMNTSSFPPMFAIGKCQ